MSQKYNQEQKTKIELAQIKQKDQMQREREKTNKQFTLTKQ